MARIAADESGPLLAESTFLSGTSRMSWSAVFAGTAVAIASIFFLLSLGAGVGLSLVTARGATEPQFLTLGAIYFFAAQAFGLAIGAHVTGRLIGPRIETAPEEEFRAAAHGLVVWGLAVVVTAAAVAISGWVAAGSAATLATVTGTPSSATNSVMPNIATYWADLLFRPAESQHAAAAWPRYAQADTGTQTDAAPAQDQQQPAPQQQPMQSVPAANPPAPASQDQTTAPAQPSETAPPPRRPSPITEIPPASRAPAAETPLPQPQPHDLAADKAETARILEVGMANGDTLSAYDKQRIAALIAADTDVGPDQAMRRVDDAAATLHNDQLRAADFARRVVRNASLWIAFSLLFGAIVAAMAAVSARWTDDEATFGRIRREPG